MKNLNDPIGNRTRDLPTFSEVHLSTLPSRAVYCMIFCILKREFNTVTQGYARCCTRRYRKRENSLCNMPLRHRWGVEV